MSSGEKITKASKNEPYLLEQGKTKYSKIDTFNKIPEIEKKKVKINIRSISYKIILVTCTGIQSNLILLTKLKYSILKKIFGLKLVY